MSDKNIPIEKHSDEKLTRKERRELEKRLKGHAKDAGNGFKAHLVVYTLTNLGLLAINVFLSPGTIPWFFFPAAAWGIGLIGHLQSWFNGKKKRRRFLSAKTRGKEAQYLIKKLHHMEGRFKQHRTAFLSCNGFLMGTNLITSPWFLWSLIPMGCWSVGLFSHWAAYKSKRKLIIKELKAQSINWKDVGNEITRQQLKTESNIQNFHTEADSIKQSLLEELKNNEELKAHWGGELEQILEKFTLQISELVQVKNELEKALGSANPASLKHEMKVLAGKKEEATNKMLIIEYDKSISQYRHQLKSLEDLGDRKEIVELRLNSALMLIRQLKLDSARIKNMKSVEEPFSLKEIRSKSDELSRYLEDIHESYLELED